MNIMLDLDGCIVDFDKGVSRIYWTIQQLCSNGYKWNDIGSDLVKKHLEHDCENINVNKLPSAKLWSLIGKYGDNFWSDLDWIPDGEILWNYVKKYNPTILTGLATMKNCDLEKRIWCARELGDYVKVITCQSNEKQNWADPNTLLIDDRLDNCIAWSRKGGPFIHHKNARQTIDELQLFGL